MGKQCGRQRGSASLDLANQFFGGCSRDLSIDNRAEFVRDEEELPLPGSPCDGLKRPTVARANYTAPAVVLKRGVTQRQPLAGEERDNVLVREHEYNLVRANIFEEPDSSAQHKPTISGSRPPSSGGIQQQKPKRNVLLKRDADRASDRDEFKR